jgi:hypothetical protein
MKVKDVIIGSPPYLFALAAAACLCLAIWFSWQDKLKAAALLSGLFLLCVVLAYFPQLDSIKAFSIDVKLRNSLDRADEILAKIRKVSIGSAKSTYMNTAWSGRFGGMSERDKQDLLDAVNEELQSVGITDEERKEIVRPYIEFIGYDLYIIFYESVRGVLWHFRTIPTESQGTKLISEWEGKWQTDGLNSVRRYLSDGSTLTSHMKEQIPQSFLDTGNNEKLTKLAENIGRIFDGCLRRGGHTEESLKFIDVYKQSSGQPHKYYNILTGEQ